MLRTVFRSNDRFSDDGVLGLRGPDRSSTGPLLHRSPRGLVFTNVFCSGRLSDRLVARLAQKNDSQCILGVRLWLGTQLQWCRWDLF